MNEVLRQEKKYWLTVLDRAMLLNKMEGVLKQDPHNGSEGYCIRSLYFDTPFNLDYESKMDGLECRRKLRLRIYDPKDSFAKLEMKQKQGNRQRKRSLTLSREDAKALIQGQYHVLLKYPDAFAVECYGLMMKECYRPKTIVEYRRFAFIGKENNIRITFDSSIVASESCLDLFSTDLNMVPVFDPFHVILEVKFNGFLLSYMKDILQLANRSECSVSKYCLARQTSCHFNI